MEIVNNIAKQQSTQVHTEQGSAETKSAPKAEIKTQAQKISEQPVVRNEVDLRDMVDSLNKALDPFNTSIKFGFDSSNEVFFVSVIDASTNDTIRRFPAEKAESLVTKMHEIVGIIFDEKG